MKIHLLPPFHPHQPISVDTTFRKHLKIKIAEYSFYCKGINKEKSFENIINNAKVWKLFVSSFSNLGKNFLMI